MSYTYRSERQSVVQNPTRSAAETIRQLRSLMVEEEELYLEYHGLADAPRESLRSPPVSERVSVIEHNHMKSPKPDHWMPTSEMAAPSPSTVELDTSVTNSSRGSQFWQSPTRSPQEPLEHRGVTYAELPGPKHMSPELSGSLPYSPPAKQVYGAQELETHSATALDDSDDDFSHMVRFEGRVRESSGQVPWTRHLPNCRAGCTQLHNLGMEIGRAPPIELPGSMYHMSPAKPPPSSHAELDSNPIHEMGPNGIAAAVTSLTTPEPDTFGSRHSGVPFFPQ